MILLFVLIAVGLVFWMGSLFGAVKERERSLARMQQAGEEAFRMGWRAHEVSREAVRETALAQDDFLAERLGDSHLEGQRGKAWWQ